MIPGNTRHWGKVKPRILDRLSQAEGDFVSTRDIIDHVWTARGIPEPEVPEQSVNHAIRRLRKLGFAIGAKRGAGSPGYRLLPSESWP